MILRKDNDYFPYLGNQLVFVEAVCVYCALGTWHLLHDICTSKAVLWLWWLVNWPLACPGEICNGQSGTGTGFFFTSTSVYRCHYHSTSALNWSFNTFLSERQAGNAWEPWRLGVQDGQKSVHSHFFMLQQNRLLKAFLHDHTLCTFMLYLSNEDTKLFDSFSRKLLNTLVYDWTHVFQFIFVLDGCHCSNQILLA